MAVLYFRVSAQYDEVIRLRQECEKLEAQLKKMDVNKSPAAARALETQLASTRQQMMGLVTEAAKAGAVMERDFKNGIYNASQTVNNLSANITSQRGLIRQLQNELTLLKEKYRETVKSGGDTTGISEQIKAQTAKLREQKDVLFGLTQQQAEARLSVKRLKDEYTAFKEEAGETVEANEKMSMSLTKVLGIIGGMTALKSFVSELINVRGEFQQLEIAFSTMLKSKEKANQLMSELVDIAAKTPFDLQGVASSAKQMLAYGSSAENVGNELVMLGNIAAGVGSQLSEIAYLYGTLRTQGRAYAVDIRQFAGRGIPIYEELAKVLGVTKDEVSSLVSEGKVGFKEVEQAFKNMTSESGIYYNLMEEQSKSLTGQLSNLGDAWDTMLNEIGKNTQGIASAGITGLKGLIEHYETVGKIIIGLIATYGTYKTVLFVTKIAQDTLTARMELAIIVTKAQAVAQAALNTVMQANPYVLVATMLAGLITTLWAFHDGTTAASAAQDRLNKSQAEFTEREEERKRKVEELIRVIQDKNETELAQIQAYDELKRYSPALAEAYTREQLATLDLAKANKTLNKERDKNQYDEITQNIQQAEQAIQRLRKQMENASKSPNSASEISFITGQLRSAEADLQQWKKALDELNKAKESLKKPTKLDIQVAEREYQDSKMKLDYMSGFMIALKKEVEGTMKLHVDGSPAEKDTNSIIKDIEKRIKEIDKVPMSVEQMKVRDDLSEIRDYMLRWKNEASKNGTFTIPIQFQLKLSSLQGDTNQKKSKFNYLTGQYESEKPELFKDAYKNAEKSWSNAKNTYNQLKNSAKSTKEEVIKAKEAMETAEKAFKELGGDPQASKKRNKVESQAIKREEAIRKQTETLKTLEQKQSLDRAKEAVDMENQIEQARIDAMAEGGDKILAQRELNNKKEMQAIDRAKEEYIQKEIQRQKEIFDATEELKAKKNPKYKKRSFDSSTVTVDTSSFDNMKDLTEQKQLQDRLKAEKEAMNSYLTEYGTFQQRKYAIAQEYADKIAKAQTNAEKIRLGKERDSKLSGIESNALKANIDWATVFGEFGGMFSDMIKPALENAKKYMQTDEFKNSDTSSQQALIESINKMEKSLGSAGTLNFKKLGEDVRIYQDALISLNDAKAEEIEAIEKLKKAQEEYENALKNGTESEKQSAKDALDIAQTNANTASANVQSQTDLVNESQRQVSDTSSKLKASMDNVIEGLQKISSGSLASIYSGLIQAGKGIGGAIGKVSKTLEDVPIIGWIVSIIDIFKDGISVVVEGLIDAVFNAVSGILEDVLSGDLIVTLVKSVVNGVGSIIKSIASGLGNLFTGGLLGKSNDAEMEAYISKLQIENEALRKSIDSLRDTIEKSDSTNKESIEAYRQALQAEKEYQENQRESIDARASQWTNTGYGFLGLGGKKSFNSHVNSDLPSWVWDSFNETLRQHGFSDTVRTAGDMWELSPEALKVLRDFDPKAWAEFFSTDGHKNPEDMVNEYIESAGKLDELTDSLNEKLTGYTWEGFRSSYADLLMDLESDTKDFADNINKLISNALIESFVNSAEMKSRIKNLYDMIAEYAGEDSAGGTELTKDEIEAIRQENESIAKDMLSWREAAIEAGLIDISQSSSGQQSASSKGFGSMSQDTGEELNGRFTALQESGIRLELESQKQTVAITELKGSISGLVTQNQNLYNIADETRTILANSYLELQQIRENTEDSAKYLKDIKADIAEVKQNTSKL